MFCRPQQFQSPRRRSRLLARTLLPEPIRLESPTWWSARRTSHLVHPCTPYSAMHPLKGYSTKQRSAKAPPRSNFLSLSPSSSHRHSCSRKSSHTSASGTSVAMAVIHWRFHKRFVRVSTLGRLAPLEVASWAAESRSHHRVSRTLSDSKLFSSSTQSFKHTHF